MTAEELPPPLDVLAVGAHPDDVEIAVGGTLARMVQQGYRVGICDLTNGEPTPGSPGPETRLAEANEAARILGVQMRQTLTLPNRCLFDSFPARIALARVIRHWRPKIVMGIAGKTPMASPDHWQAIRDMRSEGMTMVLATHEMGFAREISDTVCFLKDGRILEAAPPSELFTSPQQPETREFLERVIASGRL